MEFELNWKREYSLFYGSAALISVRGWIKEDLGIAINTKGEGKDGWFSALSTKGTTKNAEAFLQKEFKNNPNFITLKIDELIQSGKEFVEFTKSLTTKENIIEQYQQYFDLIAEYAIHLWRSYYMVEAGSKVMTNLLREKTSPEQFSDELLAVSEPEKKASWRIIAENIQSMSENKKAHYILKKFPWITQGDPFQQSMTKEDAEGYCASLHPPKASKKTNLKFTKDEQLLVDIYKQLVYLKDMRDDARREAFYLALPFVDHIAKQLKITRQELGLLLPEEVKTMLKNNTAKSIIKKRKQTYVVYYDGTFKIEEGKQAKKLFEKQKSSSTISGLVGNKGKVKGTVQVITSTKQIKDFKDGNILVVVTTNPEYIPAMKKAIAFITDEGGITSHAAIVAREMDKPCIVGCGNATMLLNNGDNVIVDGEKGVVEKR